MQLCIEKIQILSPRYGIGSERHIRFVAAGGKDPGHRSRIEEPSPGRRGGPPCRSRPGGGPRHEERRESPRGFPWVDSGGCRRQEAAGRHGMTPPEEVEARVSFATTPLVTGGACASGEGGSVLGERISAAALGIELSHSGGDRHSGGRKPCAALLGARGVHVSDDGQHGCSFGWFYQG